eukprot:1013536-Rhodomonas_salina.1
MLFLSLPPILSLPFSSFPSSPLPTSRRSFWRAFLSLVASSPVFFLNSCDPLPSDLTFRPRRTTPHQQKRVGEVAGVGRGVARVRRGVAKMCGGVVVAGQRRTIAEMRRQ